MRKNENINEQSIESIKDYHKKRIKSNICLHKICLTMFIFINLGLLIFAILYKKQISEIKLMSSKNSTYYTITEELNIKNRKLLDKKIVNILAKSRNGKGHFSFLFDNMDSVKLVKGFIAKMYKENLGKTINEDELITFLLYQEYIDGSLFENVLDNIEYFDNIAVLISSSKGKFGIFFRDGISLDENNKFKTKDKDCFMFSFETKKMYKYIGDGNCVKCSEDKIFDFGNGDLVIYNNFTYVPSLVNYPFKSFDVSSEESNPFTDESGENNFYDIEIFSFIE